MARDENLVDLETDKVVLEVPAPAAGVISEIRIQDGTTVTSGQVLAVIEEGAAAAAKDAVKDAVKPDAGAGKLSPAAKRVVEENKVDPKAVTGSGRDGRVSKSDVVKLSVVQGCRPGPGRRSRACSFPCGQGARGARSDRARRARRSARADDAAAGAHRRAHGAGAGHASLVDLVQ